MSSVDQLEHQLREVLGERAGAVLMPVGLPERLVDRAGSAPGSPLAERDRPLRRWVPVLVATAGVVSIAVAGVAARSQFVHAGGPAHGGRVVVPWNGAVQQHVTTRQWPTMSVGTVAAPAGTRPCTDRDLRLVSAHSDPDRYGNGWVATDFVLQSTSATRCSVSAYGIPTDLLDGQGRLIPDDARASGGGLRRPDAWLVTPRQIVVASAAWAHVRGRGPEPARLVILPSNDAVPEPHARLAVSLKGFIAPPEPVNPSNLGPWRTGWGWADVRAIANPGSLASLTATMAGPASAAMEATITLTVDLANRTDQVVELIPCPTVTVTLTVVRAKVGVTNGTQGPLNCAAAPHSISPGTSVRFAAQVTAADIPTGPGSVVWTLTSGAQGLVSTWAALTVRP